MPLKNSKYINCPECKRKRYCIQKNLPNFWKEYTCSRGCIWKVEYSNYEKVLAIEMEYLLPKLKDLFEIDNTFYKTLKNK